MKINKTLLFSVALLLFCLPAVTMAEPSDKTKPKIVTVAISVFIQDGNGNVIPAERDGVLPLRFNLFRPQEGDEKWDDVLFNFSIKNDQPFQLFERLSPGTYLLELSPTYKGRYYGRTKFTVTPEGGGTQAARIVLTTQAFTKCTIQLIDAKTEQPIENLKLMVDREGENYYPIDWETVEHRRQGTFKNEPYRKLKDYLVTNKEGVVSFALWDHIDALEFFPAARYLEDRSTFTLRREELLKNPTIKRAVRQKTVILHAYLRTRDGERKRFKQEIVEQLTPPKRGAKYWVAYLYNRTSSDDPRKTTKYQNFEFDVENGDFIWRTPYPKPGEVCQLKKLIEYTGEAALPVFSETEPFTVPRKGAYEADIILVHDESELKHPPLTVTARVQSTDDRALGDVLIKYSKVGLNQWKQAGTNAEGVCRMKLQPGRYEVQIRKHGYVPLETNWQVQPEMLEKTFALSREPQLTVEPLNRAGDPISGGEVRLVPADKDKDVRAGRVRNGRAFFKNLEPGVYRVIWSAPPGHPVAETVATNFMSEDDVKLEPDQHRTVQIAPPERITTLKLTIDREANNITENHPLLLLLRNSHGERKVMSTGIVLGDRSSAVFRLPAGSRFTPEVVLGWSDEQIAEMPDAPELIGADRYEDAPAYFDETFTVPDSPEGEIKIKLLPDTEHKVNL